MINPNVPKTPEFDIVKINRPVGCDRSALSLKALDAHTRKLARETYIEFNGKMIRCTSFALKGNDLILTIPVGSYTFIDA